METYFLYFSTNSKRSTSQTILFVYKHSSNTSPHLYLDRNINHHTMRKRFNPCAICSSENYIASKKAHRAMLREAHKSFNVSLFSVAEPVENEGLSIKRQIALDKMPVKVKVLGRLITITKKEFNEVFAPAGFKPVE